MIDPTNEIVFTTDRQDVSEHEYGVSALIHLAADGKLVQSIELTTEHADAFCRMVKSHRGVMEQLEGMVGEFEAMAQASYAVPGEYPPKWKWKERWAAADPSGYARLEEACTALVAAKGEQP